MHILHSSPSNIVSDCVSRTLLVADHQKTVWRRAKDKKEHDEQFMASGLWSLSRHPKYVNSKSFVTFCPFPRFQIEFEPLQFLSRDPQTAPVAPFNYAACLTRGEPCADGLCLSNCSYAGEVGLWVGIWALCTTSLGAPYVPRYTWLLAGASPLMTYFLLRKVSGVPPLEVREYSICRCSVCALCGLSCVRSQ